MRLLRDEADFHLFLSRFTNYERLVRYDYDRKTLGPDRTRALLRAIGEPHTAYPSIHIAGTKGKGSLALMLEALLSALGRRVGTYTSPHVEHLRERIRIEERPIEGAALVTEMNKLLPYLETRSSENGEFPTFFEIMTALAMEAFRSRSVDWGIFEVGLGGRLDATNVLEPRSTAITSIGLEHTRQLGDTLARIAAEKAGIIKPGIPVIAGPIPPEAEEVIRATATRRRAPLTIIGEPLVHHAAPGSLLVEGHREPFPCGPVLGPALRWNLTIALTIIRELERDLGTTLDRSALQNALLRLRLPARCEIIASTPLVVIDGAHTAESIRALRVALDEAGFPTPRTVVVSTGRDKRLEAIAAELHALGDRFICTCADAQRSFDPAAIRAALGCGDCVTDPHDALRRAREHGDAVVVTGSFYLAGVLRPAVLRQSAEVSSNG